ncbi:thioether cross-link-forming SCIFF peptide maturase [Ktedonobacteria bacterium brp13]|nr:thioether cross-link-forming SCIFF peptide maturase [Ktedonobacteria bacterium brp13]
MKIWLNRLPAAASLLECADSQDESDSDYTNNHDYNLLYEKSNDVREDCDCDCGKSTIDNLVFPSRSELAYKSSLVQTAPLYIQACATDRWLVCNPTATARIVVLDDEALALLQQFQTACVLSALLGPAPGFAAEDTFEMVALLYEQGILRDSAARPVRHELKADEHGQILTVWLHVTNACNLRCHYCYLDKNTENMSEDTAFAAVDAIFRSAQQGHFKQVHLKYSGGEASLVMSRVSAVHDYASRLAQQYGLLLSATLLSNGVMLSVSAIKQLKERHIRVMISLDGVGEYHDRQRPFKQGQSSFKYVDRTIDRLLAHDLAPYISVTVSHSNLAGLPALLRYILARDLRFSLNYYRDNDCAVQRDTLQFGDEEMIAGMRAAYRVLEEHLPQRSLLSSLIDKADLSAPHQHTCGVGHNYMVIDQHGGVAKCQVDIKRTITTISVRDPLKVLQQDRTGIQNVSVDEKEGCRSCTWRYWCTGGCPLLTYRMTGRYDIKSPDCSIYKALFPEALRLEGLRLLTYSTPITFTARVLSR